MQTNRKEDEDSIEYAGGRIGPADLLTLNDNNVKIRTDNWSLGARYDQQMLGGTTRFKVASASSKATSAPRACH